MNNRARVLIIGIAVPRDRNVESKEKEKQKKYQELVRELSRPWRAKAKVVLVVAGGLVVIPKSLKSHLKGIEIPNRVRTLRSLHFLERQPF